jgi:hypothetical protein
MTKLFSVRSLMNLNFPTHAVLATHASQLSQPTHAPHPTQPTQLTMCVCVRVYACMYVHRMYVNVCVCVFVYIYIVCACMRN